MSLRGRLASQYPLLTLGQRGALRAAGPRVSGAQPAAKAALISDMPGLEQVELDSRLMVVMLGLNRANRYSLYALRVARKDGPPSAHDNAVQQFGQNDTRSAGLRASLRRCISQPAAQMVSSEIASDSRYPGDPRVAFTPHFGPDFVFRMRLDTPRPAIMRQAEVCMQASHSIRHERMTKLALPGRPQNRKRVRPPGSVAKVTIAERGSMRYTFHGGGPCDGALRFSQQAVNPAFTA